MSADETGKLVMRSIPNDDVAQQVVRYLSASAQNATLEAVAATLKELPLVVSEATKLAYECRR